MSDSIGRRGFLGLAATTGLLTGPVSQQPTATRALAVDNAKGDPQAGATISRPYLTEARSFVDVSRGNPKPSSLKGEALAMARLTPASWRLEIVSDGSSQLARAARLDDGTAIDLVALKALAKAHGIKYVKAMQCNNIPYPLGQGLWEGVPLRDVIRHVGQVGNVRRVYYSGFHNNDPAQLFQSSLAFNRVMETPPSEPPPLVAFRLNGQDIPLERGGPVRMVVPWAHGFKSIKWLQRIVLTNDYRANDTYALQNNDPESYLKTAAYLGRDPLSFRAGQPVEIDGMAMVGWSGLSRVEFWVRSSVPGAETIGDDDPAWKSARWSPCTLMPPPNDWSKSLPRGTSFENLWGFDSKTNQPKDWPLPFSMVPWTVRIPDLKPGTYEIRARTVDLNGFAQPEPRPYQKSGMNLIPVRKLVVTA